MSKYLIIIKILSICFDWYQQSIEDQLITGEEISLLVKRIADATDVKIEIG